MALTPLGRFPRNPDKPIPITFDLWYTALVVAVNALLTRVQAGSDSPEGVVMAPQGVLFLRDNGGASTSLYVKTSGGTDPATLTNTGWVAK